jgi:LysM repeat protein
MKPKETSDPQDHFSGVEQKRGKVQKDSDWNRGVGRRQPLWVWMVLGAAVVALVVVGGLFVGRRYGLPLAFRTMRGPVANMVTPVQGSIVGVHSTVGVTGEGTSGKGVHELQLWVNDQQWASRIFDVPVDHASATWGWTPSGEGEHLLVVKAITTSGETAESETVHVLAAMAADVRFPMTYAAEPGDSLESLSQNYGTSVQDILNSNPGLDPSAPLDPGQSLTVPVPVPNQKESFPEGGFDPAPPAGPNQPSSPTSLRDVSSTFQQALGPDASPEWRDFQLSDGVLTPNAPVEKIFLYASFDNLHWQRIPPDGHAYLLPTDGGFDLKPLLQPYLDQAGGGEVDVAFEVWAWRDGALVFLGRYHGALSAGARLRTIGSTDLQAVDYVYLGKKFFTKSFAVTLPQLDAPRDFSWTSTAPGVTYGLWQVSSQPFPPGTSLHPPGLVQQGVSYGADGSFSLHLKDYFGSPQQVGGDLFGSVGDAIDQLGEGLDQLLGQSPPVQTFSSWQPRFFLVRVIPMSGSPLAGDQAPHIAGPASAPVFIYYKPFGNPYKPSLEPSGPVYEATILSVDPYRPADPQYAACLVSTYETRDCHNIVPGLFTFSSTQVGQTVTKLDPTGKLVSFTITPELFQQCTVTVPKGQQSCGCPGVSCSGSSSSCSAWDPTSYGDCLQDFGSWAAGQLQNAYNFFSGLYNDAVAFVKEWAAKLNPLCIQAKLAAKEFGGKELTEQDVSDVCQAATDIAVTAVQIYFGLPPSLPNFDQFMDEGLDYAISMTATQMGIDCNAQCVALLKKGFQAVTSGENLYQAGLDVGASMAADRLGPNCNAKCRQIIQNGIHGKAPSYSQVADAVLDQSAKEIAANLNAQGFPCDAACESDIALGLKEGAAVGETAASAAAQPKQVLLYEPDSRGVDQPAVVRVKLFRRFESANVPADDLAHCDLQVFSYETNDVNGVSIEGEPFAGQAVELPVLKPGQSITIPVVLERAPYAVPTDAAQAIAQSGPVTIPFLGAKITLPPALLLQLAKGDSVSVGPVSLDRYAVGWPMLYFGGAARITATGPAFLTSAAPGKGIPCVAEDRWDTLVPSP